MTHLRPVSALALLAAAATPSPAGIVEQLPSRWAVIVASDRYAHLPEPPSSNQAGVASDLHRLLTSRYGYRTDHVLLLVDEKATAAGFYRAAEQVRREIGPRDSLFVFFSLHTERSLELGEMLVPYDGVPRQPSTMIPIRSVTDALGTARAGPVLAAFDHCLFREGTSDSAEQATLKGGYEERARPIEILSACSAGTAGAGRAESTFGAALVEALHRAADEGRTVMPGDLADRLRERLRLVAGTFTGGVSYTRAGPQFQVQSYGYGSSQSFAFTPASRDPFMAARQGDLSARMKAVAELGQLAASDPAAAGVLKDLALAPGENADVRTAAVAALGSTKEPAALGTLGTLAADARAPATVRQAAIASLERAGGAEVITPLEKAALADGASVKAAAVRALGRLRSKGSLPVILKALDSSDGGEVALVALEAIELLAASGPAVVRSVESVLQRAVDDPSLRRSAVGLLGSIGDPSSATALVSLMQADPDPGVMRAAAASLGRLKAQPVPPSVTAALLAALKDRDVRLREAAVTALGQLKAVESQATLVKVLADRDARVRAAAAQALGLIGRQGAREALTRLLQDVSPDVRRAAVSSLGALCVAAPGSAGFDTKVLHGPLADTDESVRAAAQVAVQECRSSAGADLAVLARELASPNPEVRKAALRRAAAAGGASTVPTLVSALSDKDDGVRSAAAELLQTAPGADDELARTLSDGSPEARIAAAAALGPRKSPEALEALLAHAADSDRRVRLAVLAALSNHTDPRAIKAVAAAAATEDRNALQAVVLGVLGWQSGRLYTEGRFKEGLELVELTYRTRERLLGVGHVDLAVDLNNMAVFHQRLGEYKEAQLLGEQALALRIRALGEQDPEVAVSLTNLASTYAVMGEFQRAEPLFLRALRIRQTTLRPNDPSVVQALENLADLYTRMGKADEAERYRRQAAMARAYAAEK
jgi:HEAT repeat protein